MISVSGLISCASRLAASLAGGDKPLFEFRPGPFVQDEFVVLELVGHEAISKLSRFKVTVASRVESAVDLAGLAKDAFGTVGKAVGLGAAGRAVGGMFGRTAGSLVADAEATAFETLILGQPATLVIHSPHAPPRIVQGICTEIERLGPLGGESSDWHGYRFTVRPRFWLATKRKNSRIFQDVTVREAVNTILGEHRVPVRWSGGSKVSVRDYTVQHQETDYAFITRLIAELGCFYYFEPPHGIAKALMGGAAIGGVAQAASAFGGQLGQLANVLGFTETLVIGESSRCYSPIVSADGGDLFGTSMGIGVALAGASAAARGSASGGFSIDSDSLNLSGSAGGGFGSSGLGGAATAAVGALGRLANASPIVVFQPLTGLAATDDFVFQLTQKRSLKSKKVALRDFDYNNPSHELNARASASAQLSGSLEGHSKGERLLALNTEISSPAALSAQELEIYDHHDEYQETDVDRDHARIHLEQHRQDARRVEGRSVCQRLVPGYRFLLEDHPSQTCNKEFAVTLVEHWGQIPEWKPAFQGASASGEPDPVQSLNYRNRFECVPAGIAYRMPRPERRLFQVTETAIVVGPPGSEIHTDNQGRIKARFHWDREAKCTCWLRVAQPWSGAGWGHQVIPRVGMEVVVTFLGGDLDKPLVTSCVPNAHHPMPFSLPSGTRSGLRTESTPGGGGWNELSFEDSKGREQVYLRAEKDLNELVQHDRYTHIKHDDTLNIFRDQTEHIGRDRQMQIDGNQQECINGDAYTRIGRDSTTRINGREHHEVLDRSDLIQKDDLTLRVNGCYTILVGKSDARRSAVLHVEGRTQLSSTENTEILADKGLLLRCGESSILVGPHSVEINSPTVAITGAGAGFVATGGKASVSAKKQATIVSEKLLIKSSDASIGLGKVARIDAPQVKLNCKPDPADEADNPEPPPPPTKIELRDTDGNPIPYQRYLITLTDDSQYSGFVDKDGNATLDLEAGGEVTFPELLMGKKG